jgi:hypothetical protein
MTAEEQGPVRLCFLRVLKFHCLLRAWVLILI